MSLQTENHALDGFEPIASVVKGHAKGGIFISLSVQRVLLSIEVQRVIAEQGGRYDVRINRSTKQIALVISNEGVYQPKLIANKRGYYGNGLLPAFKALDLPKGRLNGRNVGGILIFGGEA